MHEFGITSRIVNAVLQAAAMQKAAKVLEVELLIGKLTFLNPDQVRYAYQILSRGTILDGSVLVIEEGTGVIRCKHCGAERVLEFPAQGNDALPSFDCSVCSGEVEIVRGKECLIKGIKIL